MQEKNQSYFGDVLKKLSEIAKRQEIPIDQNFKAKLKEELMAQESRTEDVEEFPAPIVQERPGKKTGMESILRKWQAVFIGLPALLFTVLAVFVLHAVFFGESGPETVFEKEYNVSFTGPFSAEERVEIFEPIVTELLGKRNSESVRIMRRHSDMVLVEVRIRDDGREEFLLVREGGKWYGKGYEFFRKDV